MSPGFQALLERGLATPEMSQSPWERPASWKVEIASSDCFPSDLEAKATCPSPSACLRRCVSAGPGCPAQAEPDGAEAGGQGGRAQSKTARLNECC